MNIENKTRTSHWLCQDYQDITHMICAYTCTRQRNRRIQQSHLQPRMLILTFHQIFLFLSFDRVKQNCASSKILLSKLFRNTYRSTEKFFTEASNNNTVPVLPRLTNSLIIHQSYDQAKLVLGIKQTSEKPQYKRLNKLFNS